jgi:ParB family chromosome partitioning protein
MQDRIIQQIPIGQLECRAQVRDSSGLSADEIAGLAQSIKEAGGILQPILVRREGDSLVVVDGHRRLAASKAAGQATVPAIVEEADLSDSEVTYRQLVLDAQRVQLNPMERARAIARLMTESQWPAATVAVKLGMSPATISKLLALQELPENVQQDVASGKVPMSTAYGLARVGEVGLRETLANEASGGRLTRDALSRKIRRIQREQSGEAGKATTRMTAMLSDGRSVTVNGRRLSIDSLIECIDELLAKAKKARSQGLELATFAQMLRDQSKCRKESGRC